MGLFRRSTPDPEPTPTAATMPDPVTDPQAFDTWVAQHAKATAKDRSTTDRPGTGIVNTGVMGNVQNNPGARGGHQTSNGRINRDRD